MSFTHFLLALLGTYLIFMLSVVISVTDDRDMDILFEWNNKQYLLSRHKADAGMAAKECAQRGHELLSITGKKENDLVKQYLNDYASTSHDSIGDVWTSGRMEENDNLTLQVRWSLSQRSARYVDFDSFESESIPVSGREIKCRRFPDCDDDDSNCNSTSPICGLIPHCDIKLEPCITYTPPCFPCSTECHGQRGNCSASCGECTVLTKPVCTITQGQCSVENVPCETERVECTTFRDQCSTTRGNCTTELKPCRESSTVIPCPSSPKCSFVKKEDLCVTTTPPCYTTAKPCSLEHKCYPVYDSEGTQIGHNCGKPTTTCGPTTTICPSPVTTCRPPIDCDPIVCQSPALICEKPTTHCEDPIITCPDPITICKTPTINCPPPKITCPEPEVVCSQPLITCAGPNISCPGVVTHCDPAFHQCPPPKVHCPPPVLECEQPTPCRPGTTPNPPTNPTCPPGFEECPDCTTTPRSAPPPYFGESNILPTASVGDCVSLSKHKKFKWAMKDCGRKSMFLCKSK